MTQIDPSRTAGLPRRHFVAGALASLAPLAGPAFAQAGWPDRPLRWIVPYAAGGPTDAVARVMAEALGTQLNQKVLVDNKPGAASQIGAQALLAAPADGYTLMTADNATLFNNWHLFPKLPYTPDSFEYAAPTGRFPLVLAIHKAVPAKNYAEWVQWARANKGKVSVATPGVGTPHHITMASLDDKLGLQLQYVPYKGESAAIVDLVSGVVPLMFIGVATARQYQNDDRIRMLAVTWSSRLNTLPELPTFDELGTRDFDVPAEQGLLMATGTPRDIVARIHKEMAAVLGQPAIRARLEGMGMYAVQMSSADFKAHVLRTAATAGEVIKRKAITAG